jgi:hypothetical protein
MLPKIIPVCSSTQPFCFHILAGSLSSPKTSTPLESSKSRLFSQNIRGGGTAKIASLESTTSRLFFPAPCLQVSYAPVSRSLSLRLDASLAIQSAPFFSAAASTSRCLRLCVILCLRFVALCSYNDANPLSRNSLVFTSIQNPRGGVPNFAIPGSVGDFANRLKSPHRFLAIRRSDFCYSAVT